MSKAKIVRFDWAIKHLLRNKANFDIIEGFLAALLNDNKITVLEILESEGNQNNEKDKFNRVDVMIKDGNGRKIIIEIQNTRESDYLERILFGTSKAVTESIDLGSVYKEVSKVISISILYFNLGIGNDYLYHGKTTFKGLNTKEQIERLKKVLPNENRFKGINKFPEYYLIQVEKYENIVSRAIDEWIYWFKNEEIAENSQSKNINKVSEKLSYLKMSVEEKKSYEYFLDRLASERDMIETAKNDGRKETEKELKPILENAIAKEKTERKEKEDAKIREQQAKIREQQAKVREQEAKARENEAKTREEEAKVKLVEMMLKYDTPINIIMMETNLTKEKIEKIQNKQINK